MRRTFAELMGDEIDKLSTSALFELAHVWAETQLDARLKSFAAVFDFS